MPVSVYVGESMSTRHGYVWKGDAVLWRIDGVLDAGRIKLLFRTELRGNSCRYSVCVDKFLHVTGAVWSSRRVSPTIVAAESLVKAVAFSKMATLSDCCCQLFSY